MKRSDWLLLVLLSLPWGASFLFYRVLAQDLPPLTIALGRVAIAAAALLLAGQGDAVWRARSHWRSFLLVGLFNNAVPFVLFAYGERTTPAGIAAICNAMTPVFTVLVARAARRSGALGWNKWAGIALGFCGVLVLVGPAALSGGNVRGALACTLAGLSYGIAALFMAPLRPLPPVTTATAQFLASTTLLLVPALALEQPWTLPPPGATTWAALLGLGLVSTALAYLIFFRLVSSAGPANAVLVTYLVPVTALALGAAVLGEAITARAVGGALLIALGLAVLDGRLVRRRAEAAP
jgi:drug/metabolite transporter (DMT)-like permease